jgi:site-specific DNA-methyltransferase (adenine-specific)
MAILPPLPAASFDACITDPPHGVLRQQQWDVLPGADLWREVLRVLKPGAPLIAIGAARTYHRMALAIEDAGFVIEDMAAWIFTTGRPPALSRLKPALAPILIARKPGRAPALNLDEGRIPFVDGADRAGTMRANTLRGTGRRRGGVFEKSIDNSAGERAPYQPKDGRFPASVMFTEPADARVDRFFVVPKLRDATAHPTAKPVLLLAHLMRAFTPAGGAIVDPFAGGGSTGAAAIATGRRAVLVERDPAFAAMAQRNLNAARQGDLGLPAGVEIRPDPVNATPIRSVGITSDHEPLPTSKHPPAAPPGPPAGPPAASGLLSAEAMAARLGGAVQPRTLERWARARRVPAAKLGRGWRFDPAAVMAALRPAAAHPPEVMTDGSSPVRKGSIHGPGQQVGSPPRAARPTPLPARHGARRRPRTGGGVQGRGERVGGQAQTDPGGQGQGIEHRLALSAEQRDRLRGLLGAPLPALGARGPSRPEDDRSA